MNTNDNYIIESNYPDTISRFAYSLWEQEGRPTGRDMEFWLQAEAILRSLNAPLTWDTLENPRAAAEARTPAPVDPAPVNPRGHFRDVKTPAPALTNSGRQTKSAPRRGLGKAKSQP